MRNRESLREWDSLSGDLPEHDQEIADFKLAGRQIPGGRVHGLSLKTGTLDRVGLSGSILEGGAFQDLELTNCDLANLRCRRGNLTRVSIDGGRLTGLSLVDSVLHDVTFRSCQLDLSSFATSKLNRVRFEDCRLGGVSLMEAECGSVVFEDCRMTQADLRGAKLKGCEFRRCDLAGIEGIEGLRGVAMEWADIIDMAGTWAAALGIEVIGADQDERPAS